MEFTYLLVTILLMFYTCSCNGYSVNVFRMSVNDENEKVLKTEKTYAKPRTANFALAKHFQDHMVLQRAPAKANIYGFASSADIGTKITSQMSVSGESFNYEAIIIAGSEPDVGVWFFILDPIDAGFIANITIHGPSTNLILNDVIFGDVWLCSGQSNMQFTVIQMLNADEELADAHNYPNIRLFTVGQKYSSTPLYDLIEITQAWTKPGNVSVGGPAWSYFSAVCWLYGKAIHKALGIPIGLVATDWGGTPVEAWSSPEALAKCGVHNNSQIPLTKHVDDRFPLGDQNNNSVLWNAMIHPLLNMTIYGAIWYQGEADAGGDKMNCYNCTFPTMINSWRSNFNIASHGQTDQLFPFGFVQLAPYRPDPNITVGFPDIRWHQTADLGFVPNQVLQKVFMASALDLPDFNSTYGAVHPRDKKDVGDRLSLSGLAVAYGKSGLFQGPYPTLAEINPSGLTLWYGLQYDLEIRDKNGFEVLCSPGIWHPAPITASDKRTVTIDWKACPTFETFKGIRYAWRESPCEFKKCAIYEKTNSLPATPYFNLASVGADGKPIFKFGGPTYIN